MSEGKPDTSEYTPPVENKSSAPKIAPVGGANMAGNISTGAAQRAQGKSISSAMASMAKLFAMSDEKNKVDVEPLSNGMPAISQGHFAQGKSGGGLDISSIASLVGAGASAMSDEEKKKNINGYPQNKVENFVNALKAYEYKYKNPDLPGAGEGKFISPMAQDIEKSELGRGMVEDTPVGKMVNYGKAGGLMLATAAMLNDKVNSLEEQLASALKKRRGK